mmetsp:Transcript_15535/g.48604  ORF Transcript_15535/g.48604 Transcript_15535/m.48604 type:complete len:317 (-) Transcript_15535:353-1303(-)
MVRTNGFDRPFHPLQVFTWALFPCLLFGYYGVVMPLLSGPLRIASAVGYTAIALVTFFSAWITSAIEPKDPHVSPEEASRGTCEFLALGPRERSHRSAEDAAAETIRCYLCESRVYASSKHCRFCDKCVLRFDHHCKWLNTCVGQKNYPYFVCVIVSTWCFSSLQLALTLYALVDLALQSRRTAIDAAATRHPILARKRDVTVAAALWTALLVPLVALVGQLVLFHVMLISQGLTTYEYILNEQRRDQTPDPPCASCRRADPPRPASASEFAAAAAKELDAFEETDDPPRRDDETPAMEGMHIELEEEEEGGGDGR